MDGLSLQVIEKRVLDQDEIPMTSPDNFMRWVEATVEVNYDLFEKQLLAGSLELDVRNSLLDILFEISPPKMVCKILHH